MPDATYAFSDGRARKVRFEVVGKIISTAEALYRIPREEDCKNNYVRIEMTEGEMTHQTRSSWIVTNPFVPWRIGNTGFFNIRDELGISTTAAHEFGHAIGLIHSPDPWAGQPGIMASRGTVVDPEFQVDPGAKPLEPGGTIDVLRRIVLKPEVEAVLINIVDIRYVGKPLPPGPSLGKPRDPNCLGQPTDTAFSENGKADTVPLESGATPLDVAD